MTENQRQTCSSCGWRTKNGAVVEHEDGVRVWRCSACAATEAFIAKVTATPFVPHRQDWRKV